VLAGKIHRELEHDATVSTALRVLAHRDTPKPGNWWPDIDANDTGGYSIDEEQEGLIAINMLVSASLETGRSSNRPPLLPVCTTTLAAQPRVGPRGRISASYHDGEQWK
jgi:hypothetical protein